MIEGKANSPPPPPVPLIPWYLLQTSLLFTLFNKICSFLNAIDYSMFFTDFLCYISLLNKLIFNVNIK